MRLMTQGGTVATAAVAGLTLAGTALGAIPANAEPLSWRGNVPNSTIIEGHNITSASLSAASPPAAPAICPPGDASVTIHYSGNGKTGLPVQFATILSAKFGTHTPCTLDGVIGISAVVNQSVGVNASQATSTGGVTKGWIGQPRASGPASGNPNPISVTLTGENLACQLVLSGSSIPASFSSVFTINPAGSKTLLIRSATGCLTLFTPGDPAGIFASYSISPPLAVSGA